MNNTNVDSYLAEGCGRCDKFRTPDCKVHRWTSLLVRLRRLVLDAGLTEEMKWGSPCYTLGGKIVVMLLSLKDHCGLAFYRGSELDDAANLLEAAGPNSQASTQVRFRSMSDLSEREGAVISLLADAIAVERAGARKRTATVEPAVPAEIAERLAADAALQVAWDRLTPGRRRSHIIHVDGAKQPATRARRADACSAFILDGRGFNER